MARKYLVTGGAGFIGSNYVHRLLSRGEEVVVLDNLSRRGAMGNLVWLEAEFGKSAFALVKGEVTDYPLVAAAVGEADVIVHLAGQVAVTTSVLNPRLDFDCNAVGTFNVLEAARRSERRPILLYASTNKVYGSMDEVAIVEESMRYRYRDLIYGIPETQSLDFHSPYGCSKGAGDQYVRDYARIYDLSTVVFRQSCIYGPRQFGIEDQGWLAWFVIAARFGWPITIYGNGKQVRDVLYIDDLLDAYDAAIARIAVAKGQVYNIGGGPNNALSVWLEFGTLLETYLGYPVTVSRSDWRPGDQQCYISDIRKAQQELGWAPKTSAADGIKRLCNWVNENTLLLSQPPT